MLSNVFLGLIERLVAKTGKRDGIGNLGGLAERTDKTLFAQMTLSEQTELISQKDDIIQLPSGKICLTTDINIISCHNVQREAKEELQNIGITSNILNFAQMKPVPLYNVKDDNYILNKWNGQGIAYAISPAAYFLPVSETVLDMIVQASHTNIHENQSEVAHFCKIKLTDALTRFGKPTTKAPSLESRDMLSDYRYPHEWLSAWYIASYLLDFNAKKLKELAISLQKKTPYLIDFKSAMQQMGQSTQDMAKTLGINSDDLNDLIAKTQMQYTLNKQQNLNINKITCFFRVNELLCKHINSGGVTLWHTKLPMLAFPAALVLKNAPLRQSRKATTSTSLFSSAVHPNSMKTADRSAG